MFQRFRNRFDVCTIFVSAVTGRGAAFCQGSEDLEFPAFDSAYVERMVGSGTNLQQAISLHMHKYLRSLDAREYRLFVEEFSLRAILTDEERREILGIADRIPDKEVEVGDVL